MAVPAAPVAEAAESAPGAVAAVAATHGLHAGGGCFTFSDLSGLNRQGLGLLGKLHRPRRLRVPGGLRLGQAPLCLSHPGPCRGGDSVAPGAEEVQGGLHLIAGCQHLMLQHLPGSAVLGLAVPD